MLNWAQGRTEIALREAAAYRGIFKEALADAQASYALLGEKAPQSANYRITRGMAELLLDEWKRADRRVERWLKVSRLLLRARAAGLSLRLTWLGLRHPAQRAAVADLRARLARAGS